MKDKCPHCTAIAIEVSRSSFGADTIIKLKCGHSFIAEKVVGSIYDITSMDGRSLRPFQVEGIKFAEKSNIRCLISDEMGLGKTVQACGVVKLHKTEVCPYLVVCKGALMMQWFGEMSRWAGYEFIPQMIKTSKDKIVPGFKGYIVSYDMLRRLPQDVKASLNIKLVILDECQKVKNHESKRAKEVQDICKNVSHIIALSGTPIMNNAGEYFTVLNILRPRTFTYYASYIRDFCDSYSSGWSTKVGGLRNAEYFHELTSDFIIRRTRAEVAPELPTISRNFHSVEMQKEFEKAYDKTQEDLEDAFYHMNDDKENGGYINALQQLTKLRHLSGWNKVNPTVEFVEDFLLDREPESKLTIFTHHLDVTAHLIAKLKEMILSNGLSVDIEEITASQSMDKRHEAVMRFKDNINSRICVASTLAAGEGLNMQFCNDAILMERQWTPAAEEQVEGRFIRIGRANEALPVIATYMITVGTVDEMFTELVEQKRAIVTSTLDNKEIAWDESSLMKELLEVVAMKGGKRWKL
jgi:SNF2 family DNA or RNA helicase